MKKAMLNELLKKCHSQLHLGTHPQKDNFIHWTFLIKEGRIISSGVNRPIEPPRCFGYHKVVASLPGFKPKLHSELDAYRRAKTDARGCVAVNVRLVKTGQARMSMPCEVCRKLLYAMNCKKVFFTTELGWGELCIT